jgi:uncharacterized protein YbjT (DUF2867 family)
VGDVVESFIKCLDNPATIGQEYEMGGPEVLTYEEIVSRVLQALGTKRRTFKVPVPLLRPAVMVMQAVLPASPVSTTLLDLLAVPNITKDNAAEKVFGFTPKAFTPENLAYMKHFNTLTTLGKFMGRATEEEKVRKAMADA